VGAALIIVGAIALAAALWNDVRQQQQMDDRRFTSFSDDPTFVDRVDLLANGFIWELPVLAIGVGVGLRLIANYTVVRAGGSIVDVDAGDPVPGDETLGSPRVIIRQPE